MTYMEIGRDFIMERHNNSTIDHRKGASAKACRGLHPKKENKIVDFFSGIYDSKRIMKYVFGLYYFWYV